MTESPLTQVLRKRLESKCPLPTAETLAEDLIANLVAKALDGNIEVIRLLWDKSEGITPVKTAPARSTKKGSVS
jgi:hypothetical protein